MTAIPDVLTVQRRYRDDIIKVLDKIQAVGRRPSRIFEDWVALTHANLTELPRHFEATVKGEQHEDLPETQELYERLRGIYEPRYFELFANAQGLLLQSAEIGYMDTIGSVYMDWGHPHKAAGQFFTPFEIAHFMGQMMAPADDAASEVYERLKEAISKSTLASAMLLAGVTAPQEQALSWYIARVIPPAMEHYEPLLVQDPCCGSGIMFLGHASTLPGWMVQLGLIRYTGQDIDRLCVEMCKINIMLYGLNGRYAPYIVAHHDALLRQGGAVDEPPEDAPADPIPFQEQKGWDPDDYVQQSLFGEPVAQYELAGDVVNPV